MEEILRNILELGNTLLIDKMGMVKNRNFTYLTNIILLFLIDHQVQREKAELAILQANVESVISETDTKTKKAVIAPMKPLQIFNINPRFLKKNERETPKNHPMPRQ